MSLFSQFLDFNSQTYNPNLSTDINGTTPLPYKNVFVLYDCSGSTNNLHDGRGRNCGRGGNLDINDGTNKTDFIALAELKGVAHYLNVVSKYYAFNGINFLFLSFSTRFTPSVNTVITDNNHLDYILKTLHTNIHYEMGGTDLLTPLKSIFSITNSNDPFHIILVTDGQPEYKKATIDYLKQQSEKFTFDITTIGAGSIQTSLGGENRYRFNRGVGDNLIILNDSLQTLSLDQLTQKHFGGNSECDMSFLMEVMMLSKMNGCYCPAYGDYSALKESTHEFCNTLNSNNLGNTINKLVYKVKLDNGLSEALPKYITDSMNKFGKIVVHTPFGWYLFGRDYSDFPPYQVKVNPLETCDVNIMYTKVNGPETFNDYYRYECKNKQFDAYSENTRTRFEYELTGNNYYRTRTLLAQ